MKTTIDAAGRIVIPKQIRREAGLQAGTEVEVRWTGEYIEIEPTTLPVRLVMEGRFLVAVPEIDVEPLTTDVVEATREQILRERMSEF